MPTAATVIDYRRRINRVMLHVDRHLDRRCRLHDLADVACFSPFHFNRVFETCMGETPHRYVHRKRMERAGFLLLTDRRRIIDIALDVGYETASAFCKGFKTFSGRSPRRFRDTVPTHWFKKTNRPFHPAAHRRNRSGPRLTARIRTLPPLMVVYRENRGIVNGSFLETGLRSFRRLTASLVENGLDSGVQAYVGIYPFRFFSLEDLTALSYTGAVVDDRFPVPSHMATVVLPGGRYAVFSHHGPYAFLMQTWNAIYLKWLPWSGNTLRDAPPFETYLSAESPADPLQASAWVFIPIH
ncbi:AraC family transcriptional regulator [Desulfosarcina alkanivorans]|jgi:AraC family transcriptional regulator|uniref:AraC family transcriptional regulator n=1 Tax=Desulfosarcina alkanivorans TaxID=571177 RepID=A0A5K7YM56_9BACT|nr:AraC family transcriptional regulator [Desulfosarcina alkanivorans]BBO70832.1 AraC family transcriptional regulator [Desulfosarcina alkanivorans]